MDLEKVAKNVRNNILMQVYSAKSGHIGGSLSCADILTVLYFNQMNIENVKDANRDRFVLSKGHCSPALYAILAEKGFIEKEELKNFRKLGSVLQGHPDMKKVKGIEVSTGSLGQGLSMANGIALAGKMDKKSYRVYCLLGDGEIEEGQVWEAAMTSSKYNLDNLCVIVDNNNLQIDGTIEDVKGLTRIEEKFQSFGFNVIKVDGHNIPKMIKAFDKAKMKKDVPTVIIAKTVKGKGVDFMENIKEWHGKAPSEEQYNMAIESIEKGGR
ncbi:MAG: transketolase [Clostridia bacterium]|nr:transketolase [Clostridia bacterium]